MLRVESIGKRFGGVQALNDCTLELESGRITGLIGPNGAGKTTMFNIIAGAYPPSAGRVWFEGREVTGTPDYALFHQGIVRTFQIPQEFTRLSVLENLMAVPAKQTGEKLRNVWIKPREVQRCESEVRARAVETLEFLGLTPVQDQLAAQLSGGQKKLLELGRAMMADPSLVLLDEPGAGVNPTLLGQLAARIRRLNEERGYTICIIEHNIDLIGSLCDHIIVLAEGRVLAEGGIDDIRNNPTVVEAYFGPPRQSRAES